MSDHNTTTHSRFSFLLKKKWIVLTIILAIGGYVVYSQFFNKKVSRPQYQTAQVERDTLVASVNASGQVATSNARSVSTTVTGVVKQVFVQNDQVVKAGTKLAEIELDTEGKQKYAQALASYQSAKTAIASAQSNQFGLQATMIAQWDSFKKLAESDTYKDTNSPNRALADFHVSEKEWLSAESQYKNQQAVISQANTNLSSAARALELAAPMVTAPISGKITGFSLQEGAVIGSAGASTTSGSSTPIANLMTDAKPTITVNLTESDATKVRIGNKATITLDAYPEKTFTGHVLSIDTVGGISSGVTSYPAVILFDLQPEGILPNMSAQASIITQTKDNVLLVPSSAVQTQNGNATIRTLNGENLANVPAQIGLASNGQTEILSGVQEGDVVVTAITQTTSGAAGASGASGQTASPFGGIGGGFGGGGGGGFGVVRTTGGGGSGGVGGTSGGAQRNDR